MDKIEKFLRTLSPKEQEALLLILQQLMQDPSKVPGIVALAGLKGMFRVRMGRYRLVFSIDSNTKAVTIVRVARRNENTYKRLKR